MTKPRYRDGCAAGSQVREKASSSDYAWNVNFNNGNVNYNHRNNNGFVRACRRVPARECQDAVGLRNLIQALRTARRGKKPSTNQTAFEVRWLPKLQAMQERLSARTWSPAPSVCFIASKPKAREIHAPDFGDRVVHHWLVPQLEAIYEPVFIHDSFANRSGKGTHQAVKRLRGFLREVQSGQGGGWYLQLDIANFFNSISRQILWQLLKARMAKAGVPEIAQRATHALLRRPPLAAGVRYRCSAAERAKVPLHKRLENAGPGRGLPIGNLSSQFFANVYLNELDQFVKHTLKAKRYVRYVDDFVLVHQDREQLQAWLGQIECFLADRLGLALKADIKLKPISAGADFLGYVIRPTYTLVRRRVVHHAREKLSAWGAQHVRGKLICATPEQLRAVQSIVASYFGHFRHANYHRLQSTLAQQFPWMRAATAQRRFHYRLEGQSISIQVQP